MIVKILLLTIVAILVILILIKIHIIKKKLLRYPDVIKNNLLNEVKLAMILNYISALTLILGVYFIKTNIFYFVLVLVAFLSITAFEIIQDFNDKEQI